MNVLVAIGTVLVVMYIITFLSIAIGFFRIRKKSHLLIEENQDTSEKRNFSIIVPFRNEEKHLDEVLNSLYSLDYPKDLYEIILVNDHSTDASVEILKKCQENVSDVPVQVLNLAGQNGKKAALNVGIDKAKNEFIVTTDADCVFQPNYLISLNKAYINQADMIIAPIDFKTGSGFLAGFQQLDMFALQGTGLGSLGWNCPTMNNGANLSYRKDVYYEVGGYDSFNTPSGDDIFLMEKFQRSEKRIEAITHCDLVVETHMQKSWTSFFSQRIRWSSKAKHYKNKGLIYIGIITVLLNICLLFFYAGVPLVEKYASLLIFLVLGKWLIDFILLFLVASFYEKKKALFYFYRYN